MGFKLFLKKILILPKKSRIFLKKTIISSPKKIRTFLEKSHLPKNSRIYSTFFINNDTYPRSSHTD
jgi:hypothetical protein